MTERRYRPEGQSHYEYDRTRRVREGEYESRPARRVDYPRDDARYSARSSRDASSYGSIRSSRNASSYDDARSYRGSSYGDDARSYRGASSERTRSLRSSSSYDERYTSDRTTRSSSHREGRPSARSSERTVYDGRPQRYERPERTRVEDASYGQARRRPMASRPDVYVQRPSSSRSGSGGGIMRFIPVVAIIAVIALVAVFAVPRISSFFASDDEPTAVVPPVQEEPKFAVEGAVEETVDSDGILHGVTADGINYTVRGHGMAGLAEDKVTLVAAGDQLASDDALAIADANAGSVGDDKYDFKRWYAETKSFIQSYDLRFINQETIMAGTKEYDYSGYPSFNTPETAADALIDTGFNLINFGTNHTFDYGVYGCDETHKIWNANPELMILGSFESLEERQTVQMIERNGILFAFLGYCYGDNFLGTYENFPDNYRLCGFDKVAMEEDIKRAQQVADVVIVSMHWGTEYVTEPNDQQESYAQFLADLGVDLVLGTHAHIIQPVKYVTGSAGNVMPVVYGLSDFVSGWQKTNFIYSGLFTCDFTRDESGDVQVGNLLWYPSIEWSDGDSPVTVRLLKDMTVDEINANTRTQDVDNDYEYLVDMVNGIGMEIPIVLQDETSPTPEAEE